MTIKKNGYRTNPIVERSYDIEQSPALPNWMKDFANNIEKSAVRPYKEDQSIFDQINSVMNNSKSKYSNVDEAVKDMQERSGLLAYRNRVEAHSKIDVKKLAQQISRAGTDTGIMQELSDKEAFSLGFSDGKRDAALNQASDILAGLLAFINPIPLGRFMPYARGYCDGSEMPEDIAGREMARVAHWVWRQAEKLKQLMKNKMAQDNPNIIVKIFQLKPQIKDTLDNYIEDTHGNLPIPNILEKIRSIHRADVSDDASWDDDELLKYINSQNIEAKKKHPDIQNDSANLGKLPHFDDRDIDPSNNDALYCLQPNIIK